MKICKLSAQEEAHFEGEAACFVSFDAESSLESDAENTGLLQWIGMKEARNGWVG